MKTRSNAPMSAMEDQMSKRYQVRPIADQDCDSLTSEIICETDDLQQAKQSAESHRSPYGCGIEDLYTGELDVGFGFKTERVQ